MNVCVVKIYLKDINLNNGNIKTCINKLNPKLKSLGDLSFFLY